MVLAAWRGALALLAACGAAAAQVYSAPAGIRPAHRRPGASILPGGRIIAPYGDEYATGPGPFGLAINSSGRAAATANIGPWRASITVLDRFRTGRWQARQIAPMQQITGVSPVEWMSVSLGIAFANERSVWVSEGNSGRVSLIDPSSDERRRPIDINQGGARDSFAGDLLFDAERNILYVADQANFRVAIIDAKTRQVIASVAVGRLPFTMALSPDGKTLYVTNAGLFRYQVIPGGDPNQPGATGLSFPAFGYPSADATAGREAKTASGMVRIPGLGAADSEDADSVFAIDVSSPASAKVTARIRTGGAGCAGALGGSSPSGVVATADRVWVANAGCDSVTEIDAKTNTVVREIPIRIPGLEAFRGVMPTGLAYDSSNGWLLAAEAGINAVAVIDAKEGKVLGHVPVGWYPVRVATDSGSVFVANAKGHGVGPNGASARTAQTMLSPQILYQGSISVFTLPKGDELKQQTDVVMRANGFTPHAGTTSLPSGVKHVVLIIKEGRSFDEVLGDLGSTAQRVTAGEAGLARLGSAGAVDGGRVRLSIKEVNLTPNHHALAREFAISDNFYSDADGGPEGHHWLAGAYPNPWTFSSFLAAYADRKDFRAGPAPGRLSFAGLASAVLPEDTPAAGTIWRALAAKGISSLNFGEGIDLPGDVALRDLKPGGAMYLTNAPVAEGLYESTSREYPTYNTTLSDQYRASQFIHEIDERFAKPGKELPGFVTVSLPGDARGAARPEEGYPYPESYVVDNDLALGRIVEYLANSKWWQSTVVFVTESSAVGGRDHISANRTLLLAAGPWVKQGYTSHVNTSFPGLLKTVFELLHAGPLNLFDAAASDLSDLFGKSASEAKFAAAPVDKRVFDDKAVKE